VAANGFCPLRSTGSHGLCSCDSYTRRYAFYQIWSFNNKPEGASPSIAELTQRSRNQRLENHEWIRCCPGCAGQDCGEHSVESLIRDTAFLFLGMIRVYSRAFMHTT